LLSALATLKAEDLHDLLKDGDAVEVACEYCHTPYRIPPSTLRGLLTAN
jgi:redox-regulated HSP33 family molecular chaperone